MFKKLEYRLEHMQLKKRLNMGYNLVIGLMIVSGIFSAMSMGVICSSMSHYVKQAQAADTAIKMCSIDLNVGARNIREMIISEDTSSYQDYRTEVEKDMKDMDTYMKTIKSTGVISDDLYQQYVTAVTDWATIGENIMVEIENGQSDQAKTDVLEKCTPALNNLSALTAQIDQIVEQRKAEQLRSAVVTTVIGLVEIVIFIVLAVLLATKTGKIIIRSVTVPLCEVEKVAEELTAGNLHSQLEYHSDDEIGSLAHSLRKSIRILGSYVDDISRSMKEFSAGNFDVKPEVQWKGDFVGILEAVTKFEESMAETITGIHDVSYQVKSASGQVASSSNDLAQGATDQAAVTEQLAATIESVSSQVDQNTEDAKNISKRVGNSGVEIANSNGKMQEMVEAMGRINDSSREISKIIATINEIASQTNLLALNASIEAARAGEAGKGFAVVADQVSVLAAQSADAAKESTTLIETSVSAVEQGMVIADETAKQLEHVVEISRAVTEDVNNMAQALETQKASMEQINSGIAQINDVVQTNSATSQECAAASEEMSSQAESLDELIGKFQISSVK